MEAKKFEELKNRNSIEPSDIKEIVGHVLETKALNHTLRAIRKFAKKAEKDLLELKNAYATQTLKIFVVAQPRLFVESLPTLQVKRN